MISFDAVEVGDFLAWTHGSGAGGMGIALRHATVAEVTVRGAIASDKGLWVWSARAAGPGGDLLLDVTSDEGTPVVILSLIKSHKTASDDLGPAVGLSNPALHGGSTAQL